MLVGVIGLCLITGESRALDSQKRISQYAHTAWRLQDGFLNGTPAAVAQTTDGYIWIGTQNSLFRFDGVRFVPWKAPTGQQLSSMTITSLAATPDGSLWIATDRRFGPVDRRSSRQVSGGWPRQ